MSGSKSRQTSARQLRARLLVTFSWLRSFLIVDDRWRSFLKRDRPCPLVLVCNGMKLRSDAGWAGFLGEFGVGT